jgi:hypothetical protein
MMQGVIGEIFVFQFPECSPGDMGLSEVQPEDRFVVYNTDGEMPRVCRWKDNCFQYEEVDRRGEWIAMLNVDYWFRIPTSKEMYWEHLEAPHLRKGKEYGGL